MLGIPPNLSTVRTLQRAYLRLPVFLQHIMVSIEGWRIKRRRMGGRSAGVYQQVASRYHMTDSALREYQEQRLRTHMTIAGQSRFWRDAFERCGVDLKAPDILSEHRKLPVIHKADILEHVENIRLDQSHPGRVWPASTSGTTGTGLQLGLTEEGEWELYATWWRARSWHGISPDDLCAFFGGRTLVQDTTRNDPPFYRLNWPGRQLVCSTHHLTPENAQHYVHALRKHKVTWITGFPSFISLLAHYIDEQNLGQIDSLKVVMAGAETLSPSARQVIKRAFGVPVHQTYCQGECVASMAECEEGRLHVDEDFALVEFLPSDEKGLYQIVGTNWINPAFPLIRYTTGDLVILSEQGCTCGRPGRVAQQILGRNTDYLVLADGRRIGRLNFIFRDLMYIREAQFVQDRPGAAIVWVVKRDGYDENGEEARLRGELALRVSSDMKFEFKYTDAIPRTKLGKLRLVVQNIRDDTAEKPATAGPTASA